MNLDYVPLLRVMRELQSIPRGQPPDFNGKRRFRQYLRTIFDYDRKVVKLVPLFFREKKASGVVSYNTHRKRLKTCSVENPYRRKES